MPPGRLKDRVALVTGGGRGIGRAVARLLAREGASVAICSRTERELEETVRQIAEENGRAFYIAADLASTRAIRSLVRDLIRRYSRIDILVNNASRLGPRKPMAEYPLREWEAVLKVNLTAPFFLTQEVLRAMIPQRSGCIINITSSVGRKGRALWGGYSVSKFGIEGLTQILAEELREHQIRVLSLNPGATRTRMRAAAYPEEDPTRLKSPEAAAKAVLHFALHDDMAASGRSFDAEDILKEMDKRSSA